MITPGDSDFIEVVPAAPFSDADESFRKWLHGNGLQRSDLRDEDIRIDTVRGLDGRSLRRYKVRGHAIPRQDG
jgi:hypothetical protein